MDPSLPKAAGCLKRKRSLSDAADPDLEDGSSWKENNGGNSSSATTVLAAHGQGSGAVDPGHEFHVFLSFRGPDIRKTFADVLYHKLIDVGVHTFLDSEKLHVGKQIGPELMRAIKQSKICIPIFTKYYASSKWCLREVTEMMKLKENPEREIIPIFIDVTPDEVQRQSGSYKEAFTQHEKNLELDPATVREWRDALKKVLSLKGLELKIEADGKYGKFAHLVAAEVLRKLRRAWKLNEGDNLVGLDHPVKVVMQLLDKGRMVGIWGAGGIGKTTLAKNVYNQIANGFECCCFLGDIRENSKNGGLLKLQEKLVSQLLGQQNHHFTSTDEGIDVLKYRVRGKKALILLDDVDAIDQIEALSADPRWFGEGSRILITARDQGVLKYFTWCKIYDHKPLDKHQARELFSKYAFRDDSPSTEFADLSKEIVDIIGRLPLTLKTTGSTLFTFGGKKDIWEDAKNKLKKGEPLNDDVRKKLMISYEYLDDKQKNIFLDIVCFFIGKDYRTVIPVWRHCSMSPKLEIEVLQYKSLIKIDDENIIQMHDELRDLGRHIVDQQGRKPEQRSRLWRNREVIDMLRGHKETKHIEGALISEVKTREILHGECFKNLSKLKILMVNGDVSLDQNCEHLLPNLRWLTWSNNKRYLPSNLHLQKLVVLDLSGCISLDDHWGGWKTIKSGSLESLIIDGTRVRELPISAQMKNLEFLSANYCRELVRIPESIGSLVKLKRLSLEWCKRLKTLPKTIGRLSSLTELQLCGCGFRWLPKSIENLTNLEVMDARHSYYLHGEVPVEIGSHAHSKFLTIFLTKDDMLPDGISKFKKLEVLYLYLGEHWTQLDLPKLPSSLRRLIVTSVGGLFFDPWKITDSEYMDQVELEENSYKLEFLRMENVNITALTEGMSSFTRLKEVQIAGCKMLRCLPTLPSDLRSLT
ncbi:hypothetical protein SAY86_022407 [Trapa natans]|uniref:TIR domain-containing protein n=1 Tax=Trapa natans TaxID=22666 RepID=A0AAN7R6Y3_TRANT|nr:hypothetical protein SAY86_022407 [Trapa natans]